MPPLQPPSLLRRQRLLVSAISLPVSAKSAYNHHQQAGRNAGEWHEPTLEGNVDGAYDRLEARSLQRALGPLNKKTFVRDYHQHKGVSGGSAVKDAAEVPSG